MITEELKRSQESYIQRVLDIAKEMPKAWSPDVRRQYYALKDICYGLRSAAIESLEEMGRIIEIEMRKMEEQDGNPKAPATKP